MSDEECAGILSRRLPKIVGRVHELIFLGPRVPPCRNSPMTLGLSGPRQAELAKGTLWTHA